MSYEHARYARDNLAKAQRSGFKVGVLLSARDRDFPVLFSAGNVEHENSGLNICAERMALANAVMQGATPLHMVMVTDEKEPTFPCGVCRQYMAAFPKLKVTVWSNDGTVSITKTAAQLLPNPYKRRKDVA